MVQTLTVPDLPMTPEEFDALPEPDGIRFELVEVVSAESRERDTLDQPREYADAGIPEYWIVDDHPTDETDGMVSVFRLELTGDGPRYQLRERVGVRELVTRSR